jgi:hypothetical protein
VAQNGIPQPGSVQSFIGPHWGRVGAFALRASDRGVPIDPGSPPAFEDSAAFRREALAVIRRSADLDPRSGVSIDIGPGALGDNALGANDGRGHDMNPVTGKPYARNVVPRGDYARALAEYWADGPRSETPPGHWNSVANEVSDSPGFARRIGGRGPEVDPLEWDVKLYLALNGAVHDSAVAAWGLKGHYDSARPISIIRYLGERNELPTVPGLVERRGGETYIRAWAGSPKDPATQSSGVRWIRAVDWVPYQLPTFVTPAFAGYVSGHSTFSRAAAEVLTAFTGTSYFPGGLYEVPIPRGHLKIEHGPSRDVKLQWATYFDAADAAGQSRLWMGIHIPADDFVGRRVGAQCGKDAWALAKRYFEGTAKA